eukprot:1140819-Pelagomonas_calceolata.AAC.3
MGIWRVVYHAPGCPDSPSLALYRHAPSTPPEDPRKLRASLPGTKEGAQADKPPDEKGVVDWAHLKASEMLHGVDGMWKKYVY